MKHEIGAVSLRFCTELVMESGHDVCFAFRTYIHSQQNLDPSIKARVHILVERKEKKRGKRNVG